MKNFFKKTTLIPILFAMLIYSPLITSHATHLETQTKRQSLQKGSVVQDQHVFAIPDNGWNVVDIELDITNLIILPLIHRMHFHFVKNFI